MEVDLIVIEDGVSEQVGQANFTAEHIMTLNTTSLTWSEQVTLSPAQLSGAAETSPITLTLLTFTKQNTVTKATGQLAGAFTLSGSSPETGTIDYSSRVNKMQDVTDATHYIYEGEAAGFTTPITLGYDGPTWRCDDMFWNKAQTKRNKVPGCVLPQQAATDTSMLIPSAMYSLPGIKENIQTVQENGVHVGRPFSGEPLHRTTEAQKDKNRGAVCDGLKPPTPGLSCDEYPFASTAEGGTFFAPPNRGIAWVPIAEQRKQGGILKSFYSQNRILPGDPFYFNVWA
ncbi:NucA/NucB deoxyribonuclease domain-containing protein [Streptomyces sp. RB6PN25]|uniref:NucA/NucB deoxyribonuclease domain-containing protein n=1 Tax=Streptomyces humicola TaxID=2953240 RepID=A0ABT1PTA2_9ACTN|nr:NucA/NucB deoxyribonuclease domain-containing protein [Streptomyces humicola]MCQ4079777.1 NucA/NucB deoxyribonuclease domain-containing protein [Streptomyces humicola]